MSRLSLVRIASRCGALALLSGSLAAQTPQTAPAGQQPGTPQAGTPTGQSSVLGRPEGETSVSKPVTGPDTNLIERAFQRPGKEYKLGAGDAISIRASYAEEISATAYMIDSEGTINVPLLGKLKAGGKNIEELETEVTEQLKKYVKSPQVIVNIVQFRSEPVFLVGAFRTPGIFPLQGRRTVIELLSSIGGLQPNASRRIKLTRRMAQGPIPLPAAIEDKDAKTSWVEIDLSGNMEVMRPEEDLVLQPFDVLKAATAEMIYISGEVARAGAFELHERQSLSVTQLLSMAGGVGPNAAPDKAKVLRAVMDTNRRAEIPLDVKRILSGQANDFPLMPNDVLMIPRSKSHGGAIGKYLFFIVPSLATSLIYVLIRR